MIETTDFIGENIIGLKINGRFTAEDVARVFRQISSKFEDFPRIRLFYEVTDFDIRDVTFDIISEEFAYLFNHPGLMASLEKAVMVTDQSWLRKIFTVEMALIPTITGKAFTKDQADEALEWLRKDHRAASQMDLVFSEFIEYGTLKALGGFGIGLLAADLLSSSSRRKLGLAALGGGILIGIPMGIRVLNNNRRLINKEKQRKPAQKRTGFSIFR